MKIHLCYIYAIAKRKYWHFPKIGGFLNLKGKRISEPNLPFSASVMEFINLHFLSNHLLGGKGWSILWHYSERSFTTCWSQTHTGSFDATMINSPSQPWLQYFPEMILIFISTIGLFSSESLWLKHFPPIAHFCAVSLRPFLHFLWIWSACRDGWGHLCDLLGNLELAI